MANTLDKLSDLEGELQAAREFQIPGLDLIIDGLLLVAVHIDSEETNDTTVNELLSVVSKFISAATASDQTDPGASDILTTAPDHIIALFREEARKRLAGLSISMMGIFYEESSEASIDQSAGHLHAVKGAAAMIGFRSIASLAETMERVVFSMRKRSEDEKTPALKPLLRSFSVLESLVEDIGETGGDDAVELVLTDLFRLLGEERELTDAPEVNPFDREQTGVNAASLTKRILVVDDERTVAATVGLVLSDLGVEIDVVEDGQQALFALSDKPYSLVISDLSMPHIDGITLIDAMRNDESFADIPIILLTGRHDDTGTEKADDLIIKGSIGSGELQARVSKLLKDAPAVPKTEAIEEDRSILIVEDAETVAASIALVLSEGPYEITIAFDGQDGLEKLKSKSFDLVISDWQMPRMNGMELLSNVRSDSALASLPFLMLTSTDSEELRAEADALDVSEFLIKGEVQSASLLHKVGTLIEP